LHFLIGLPDPELSAWGGGFWIGPTVRSTVDSSRVARKIQAKFWQGQTKFWQRQIQEGQTHVARKEVLASWPNEIGWRQNQGDKMVWIWHHVFLFFLLQPN